MKKKTTKRNFRKLPKYALGTMKTPIDMGYLKASGIGSALFTVQPGISILPETLAIRQNTIPKALNYALMQAPFITEMLKSTPSQIATTAATTSKFVPSFATNVPLNTIQATPGTLSNAVASTTGGKLLTGGSMQTLLNASTTQPAGLVKQGAERAGTSAVGTTMGAIGTALGAYTMANQIADFGSHRTGLDMMLNVGRQQYSTDYGNSYTNYTGVNAGQELDYERANARSKQLGFGVNAIGTGASLGGLLGSAGALGSIGGPIGSAIGAGVGLLLGGLGSLLGWGDNEEEVKRLILLTNDNIAMYNREQEAVAKSKDVAAEFNNKIGSAKTGKNAYESMDAKSGDDINIPRLLFDVKGKNNVSVGIPKSKLMPGEVAVDKNNIEDWGIVPGKGKKDSVYSAVTPGDSITVYRLDEGIADTAAAVLKSNAPKNIKQWLLNELEKKLAVLLEFENNQKDMKKYKNGKLPGYWKGTDYLMSAIPHLAALGSSWNLYNRARLADMPDYPNVVDNNANTEAINMLGRIKSNVKPIIDNIHNNYRYLLHNINNVGTSAGEKMVQRANAFINKNKAQSEALAQADEINNKYTADYANALSNYGRWMSEMMTNNNYARAAFRQQLNAAKEGWMAQYEKNGLTALADLASDIMGVRQFNRSEDYQNRMLKLYGQLVENDNINAQAELANAEKARLDRAAAYREAAKQAAEKTYPTFANYGIFRPDGIWNAFGDPVLNYKLSYPQFDQKYTKYFKPVGYEDGKGGFVSRGTNKGVQQEEIQPGTLFGIGEPDGYSVKLILPKGDTVYQKQGILNGSGVIRKKGEPASKEYIKAKLRHERLLKNATPSYNIGMDQLLRLFGF